MMRIIGEGHPRVTAVRQDLEVEAVDAVAGPCSARVVDMHYATINPKDVLVASGQLRVAAEVTGLGIDGVGLARNPDGSTGQPVALIGRGLGEGPWGTFATRTVATDAQLVEIPAGLSLRQAAGFGTTGLAAIEAARQLAEHHERLGGDLPVLVTGANGAVGSLASQYLLFLGIPVVGMVRSAAAHEVVSGWGIQCLRQPPLDDEPRAMSSSRFAGILDTVGGALLGHLAPSVAADGLVLSLGSPAGHLTTLSLMPLFLRQITLRGFTTDRLSPERVQEDLNEFGRLTTTATTAGSVSPLWPSHMVSLAELPEVLRSHRPGTPTARTLVEIPRRPDA